MDGPHAGGVPGDGASAIEPVADADTVFEAVLSPHQSLNRRGLVALGSGVAGVSALIAFRWALVGAWPVMAFTVLEIGFALGLLTLHRRQALRREIIRLSETEITVVRTDPDGRRRSMSMPAAWLQVHLEQPADGGSRRLWLRSHGRGCEIGAFLHDPERESLFEALDGAVHGLRHPTFQNAQLLEC